MRTISWASFVMLFIGILLASRGAEESGSITCQISGVTNVFSVGAQAIYTDQDGLQVFALADPRNKMASLSLTIPSSRLGTMSLKSAKNLSLQYNRSIYSSSMDAQFTARTDIAGTTADVIIEKLGDIGEPVAGRFSGLLANSLGQQITITNGTFLIIRRASVVPQQATESSQPFDPHEPCEGPWSPR